MRVDDVVMDRYGNIGLVIGKPQLMQQWLTITFDGKTVIPMLEERDGITRLGPLDGHAVSCQCFEGYCGVV